MYQIENGTQKLLIDLMRHELFATPVEGRELSDADYHALMDLARRQTVQGLVCSALMDGGFTLGRDSSSFLFMETLQLKKANQKVSQGLVNMTRLLQKHGIRFVIVKGQMVGSLYPHPDLRCPGDVDLYFPEGQYEKAKALVEGLVGKQLDKLSDGKHVEVEIGGVVFELHNILSQLSTTKHQQWFNHMIDEAISRQTSTATILGVDVPTLDATENVLYVFMHLFFHLTAAGVGLRQFADLAMLIHHHAGLGDVDSERLRTYLNHLGYERAFRAVAAFLVEVLALPESEVPLPLLPRDYSYVRTIYNNVLAGGNFGRSHRRVKQLGVLHSMESGWLNIRQILTFAPLAPSEITGRFWSLGSWFLTRFAIKRRRRHS